MQRRGPWSPRARELLNYLVAAPLFMLLVFLRLCPRDWLRARVPALARMLARCFELRSIRRNLRAIHRGILDPLLENRLTIEAVEHMLWLIVDIVKVLDQHQPPPTEVCDLVGLEHVDRARAQGRGVVMVSLHMGHWEVGLARVACQGYPLGILYFEQLAQILDDYLNRLRSRHGPELHHQRRGLLRAFRGLTRGGLLGMMVDQDGTRAGLFLRFFGALVSAPRGIAAFSRRTGSPVIVSWNLRQPDGRYIQYFDPPLPVPGEGEDEEVELILARRILDRFEEIIAGHPTQWLLAYDRFKLRHETRLEELGAMAECQEYQRFLDNRAACLDSRSAF